MERFHYCFAADFLGDPPVHDFQDDGLDQAAGNFYRSLLRIQSLGRLPIMLTGAAIITEQFDALAKERLGIKQDAPELWPEHPSFNLQRLEEKETLRKKMQGEWFNAMKAGKTTSGIGIGEDALSVMVPAGGDELEEGIDATLSAMVTGMWTAFEVVAEQVWHATDAARPHLKQALQGQRNVGHRSALGIRRRYGFTFVVNGEDILRIVDDSKVEALALVRNVIVHTGGKRDGEFNTRAAPLSELNYFTAPNAPVKIKLTGQAVLNLIKPLPELGLNLAIAVDKWLLSNP